MNATTAALLGASVALALREPQVRRLLVAWASAMPRPGDPKP